VQPDIDRPRRIQTGGERPVLKSVCIVPIVTTASQDSTKSRTVSSISRPSYIPM
jgi:hypothetical protein